jgi:hypothetical protein
MSHNLIPPTENVSDKKKKKKKKKLRNSSTPKLILGEVPGEPRKWPDNWCAPSQYGK